MRCGACGRLAVLLLPVPGGGSKAGLCLPCLRRMFGSASAMAVELAASAV